jgi:hypothetical protein
MASVETPGMPRLDPTPLPAGHPNLFRRLDVEIKIQKPNYYRLSAMMCESDLKDTRDIFAIAIDEFSLTVEQRAVALRWKELMDKQREMPK